MVLQLRRSEFKEIAAYIFGSELASVYTGELALVKFGSRTADEAIEAGFKVKDVWHELCDQMDVPEHQRLEIPPEDREIRA